MTVVFTTSALAGTDDGDSDSNNNQGCVFLANSLTAAAGANQCRITFQFGNVCPTSVSAIDGIAVGRGAGAGSLDYNGNQCQLLVGGSSSFNGGTNVSVLTDWSTFAAGETFDNTKDLVIRFHFLVATLASVAFATVSNVNFGFAASGGADNSLATTAGYSASLSNTDVAITKIEMQASGGGDTLMSQTCMISKNDRPNLRRTLTGWRQRRDGLMLRDRHLIISHRRAA